MSQTLRFSVSIDSELMQRFDAMINCRGYENRSEALRDVMRQALVRDEWAKDQEIVGTITLVYDHHKRDLSERLTTIQHDHVNAVLSTLHIHLDHDNCLEVIVVRGPAKRVQQIADSLIGTKGVKHGKLCLTTTGENLV